MVPSSAAGLVLAAAAENGYRGTAAKGCDSGTPSHSCVYVLSIQYR
ncbi:hypothetical protein [Streptomyces sp. NPDC093097]